MSKWIEYGPPRMGEPEPLRRDELLKQRNEALDLLGTFVEARRWYLPVADSVYKEASTLVDRLRVKRALTQFQEKALREALRGVSYNEAIGALCDAIDDLRKEIK